MTRILIIEDEARIASFISKGLSASGLVPHVVEDGASGLAVALSGEFDLVVLDVGLPGMGGFEVLRRLRESGDVTPVIILTARDRRRTSSLVWRAGPTTTCPSPSVSVSCSPGSGCGFGMCRRRARR